MIELPSSGLLDGRALPVVETPFASRVTWRVTLPRDACKAEGQDVDVTNDVGAFHQTVAVQGRSWRSSAAPSCAGAGSTPPPSPP